MTLLRPQVAGIPVPQPSLASVPYWEGCRAGELRYQRCPDCDALQTHPVTRCWRCHRPGPTWQRATGRGTLYSWTVVWRPQHPAFEVPYAPAIVTLAEGPRVLAAVVGCEPEALADGMALEVTFHRVDDEITLPFFRPA
jgi:uncharacterized OB-fold protein